MEWVEKGKVIRSLMGLGDTFGTSSSAFLLLDLFLSFVFAIPTQYTFMQQPDSVSYSMPVLAKAIEGVSVWATYLVATHGHGHGIDGGGTDYWATTECR